MKGKPQALAMERTAASFEWLSVAVGGYVMDVNPLAVT
jgi:hypothetical protein